MKVGPCSRGPAHFARGGFGIGEAALRKDGVPSNMWPRRVRPPGERSYHPLSWRWAGRGLDLAEGRGAARRAFRFDQVGGRGPRPELESDLHREGRSAPADSCGQAGLREPLPRRRRRHAESRCFVAGLSGSTTDYTHFSRQENLVLLRVLGCGRRRTGAD